MIHTVQTPAPANDRPSIKHDERAIHGSHASKYVGDIVFGANDGLVTTFAVIAGSAGAGLDNLVVVILGLANMFADGISMGLGNYLSAKSEADYARGQRKAEEWEIEHLREGEIDELREIFEGWGFTGALLEQSVQQVTADKRVWADIMMKHELGIIEESGDKPAKHGVYIFFAFLVAGAIPLLSYFFDLPHPFAIAAVLGAVMLFTVGALRSRVSPVRWWRAGLEMLIIGSIAAAVAYFVGDVIESIVR